MSTHSMNTVAAEARLCFLRRAHTTIWVTKASIHWDIHSCRLQCRQAIHARCTQQTWIIKGQCSPCSRRPWTNCTLQLGLVCALRCPCYFKAECNAAAARVDMIPNCLTGSHLDVIVVSPWSFVIADYRAFWCDTILRIAEWQQASPCHEEIVVSWPGHHQTTCGEMWLRTILSMHSLLAF